MSAPATSSTTSPHPQPDGAYAPALPGTGERVGAAVDARLIQVLQDYRRRWRGLVPASDELLDAAAQLLSGGKRTRALLSALGATLLLDGDQRELTLASPVVARTGAALELYQASALVHDDIIDSAHTRRGMPAAHRRLEVLHRDSGWLGDSETFGRHGALLLGDVLLSLAAEEMSGLAADRLVGPGPDAARRALARSAFDSMTAEVAVGQYLDIRSEVTALSAPGDDPLACAQDMHEHALAVVRHKSARYSVMHPLLIGALLGGVEPGTALYKALAVFGEEVGTAFQLRDDDLGVFGDPRVTGKPAGDDLREGKRTVLLSLAWRLTDDDGRHALRAVLAQPGATEADLASAARVIEDCGAREAHEAEVEAHLTAGLAALHGLEAGTMPEVSSRTLEEAAHALTRRRA
ncbi:MULTISPECIES: polyprenyl synthetase family protein [Actinomyces]|uniref:Polyprenyl synthetase family protein n=1 Tax=Actinomyces respiraculi TaxID=2744574 RepID=A0A7T0PVC2_9ACTO|nr:MULTISPECIES: polyprenyl synthetase family protein [Actinomyces]QPL04539.1 polyprenyl synthetase family protein [Actinomyces respiraculi]